MKPDTNQNIADYYNQTLNHYQQWWHLNSSLAVHYGIWDRHTRNFAQALENTNKVLMDFAGVTDNCRILDAGCGVGGSAFYLAKERKARITGITLSQKQLDFANRKCLDLGFSELVDFRLEDYTNTSFSSESFDLIWAVESVTSAPDKGKFAVEAARLLKKGGKLVVADYFLPAGSPIDSQGWLEKWQDCWSLAKFLSVADYSEIFQNEGLGLKNSKDITQEITPSAKYMYRAYLMGALPSMIYNLFHETSRYARNHYKSGKYQYLALKAGLWEYWILLFEKK